MATFDRHTATHRMAVADRVRAAIALKRRTRRDVCAGTGMAEKTLDRKLAGNLAGFTADELIAIGLFLEVAPGGFLIDFDPKAVA